LARGAIQGALLRLLAWQVELDEWPRPRRAPHGPRATPIVSLYADGVLRGCAGSSEGTPGERLARAFLHAESDLRFGGIPPHARKRLVAQVAYPFGLTRIPLAEAAEHVVPGAHGLALALPGVPPALLLPDVAREHELDALGFLGALEHKAGLKREHWPDALFTFETDRVTARLGERRQRAALMAPLEAGVRWLAARVGRDGRVGFGLEPRTGELHTHGPMLHGRAAVVLQALGKHPAGRAAATRVRRWLTRELAAALRGRAVESWPAEVPLVAGTLALCALSGLEVREPLRALARHPALAAVPWHAAQVVCALGPDAPEPLYRACVEASAGEPLAPWTVMAARARGDRATFLRTARALATRVATSGPHAGGVALRALPELALTAAVVEALSGAKERPLVAARERALRFVERLQHLSLIPPDVPDPALAFGAFPLTPVHAYLRADVTAHAVLALALAR
jgi:hypothetical protein